MSVRALPVASATGVVGAGGSVYRLAISSTGTPDKFQWQKDGGTWSAEISISGASQTLETVVNVTFRATTGHTLGTTWTVGFAALTADETIA